MLCPCTVLCFTVVVLFCATFVPILIYFPRMCGVVPLYEANCSVTIHLSVAWSRSMLYYKIICRNGIMGFCIPEPHRALQNRIEQRSGTATDGLTPPSGLRREARRAACRSGRSLRSHCCRCPSFSTRSPGNLPYYPCFSSPFHPLLFLLLPPSHLSTCLPSPFELQFLFPLFLSSLIRILLVSFLRLPLPRLCQFMISLLLFSFYSFSFLPPPRPSHSVPSHPLLLPSLFPVISTSFVRSLFFLFLCPLPSITVPPLPSSGGV